jgi:DAHL domain
MEAMGQTSGYLESLIRYCTQVRQRLQTFDAREKRLALEALDIRVTWTPNEPIAIQGSIPLIDIVPVPSDNALLQNSLMYVLHAGQALRSQAIAAGQEVVAADVGALAHALLRFLRTSDSAGGNEVKAIMARLPSAWPFSDDLSLLVAHGRLIVDVLPQVDVLLRQLISTPTTIHAQALRNAVLQHYKRVEARAQIFRTLLTEGTESASGQRLVT